MVCECRTGLGRCYEALGDGQAALDQYGLAVEADSGDAYTRFCRGQCLLQLGEAEWAAADMLQVTSALGLQGI